MPCQLTAPRTMLGSLQAPESLVPPRTNRVNLGKSLKLLDSFLTFIIDNNPSSTSERKLNWRSNETQKVAFWGHNSHAKLRLQTGPEMQIFIQICSKCGVFGSESSAGFLLQHLPLCPQRMKVGQSTVPCKTWVHSLCSRRCGQEFYSIINSAFLMCEITNKEISVRSLILTPQIILK